MNESIVVSDSLVGFSIDKYMGIDYPLYKKYFYDHQIVTMSPERIVTDCLFYYLKDNYPLPDDAAGTLLENMVLMGKLNWITCKLTHGNRLEDMLGLTSEGMQWIKDNRGKLLDYLKAHYNSTDPQVLRNLLNNTYNPTIGGKRSPGLLGVWVGFQMVNQYMKNHQHLSLQELATANNVAEIAEAYNYKIE
ncbi:MAG: hypothetical protein HUJ99_02095 [Bacteroidaceae bacterium]|nr:hypothetical protein [Bacteroidaceae bacterium]